MIEYRLSPEDDELDDLDEGAELSLDDDLGDYGLDDDDEELAVPVFAPRPPAPVAMPGGCINWTRTTRSPRWRSATTWRPR